MMGEAKRRGTYEQRVAMAKERQQTEAITSPMLMEREPEVIEPRLIVPEDGALALIASIEAASRRRGK